MLLSLMKGSLSVMLGGIGFCILLGYFSNDSDINFNTKLNTFHRSNDCIVDHVGLNSPCFPSSFFSCRLLYFCQIGYARSWYNWPILAQMEYRHSFIDIWCKQNWANLIVIMKCGNVMWNIVYVFETWQIVSVICMFHGVYEYQLILQSFQGSFSRYCDSWSPNWQSKLL